MTTMTTSSDEPGVWVTRVQSVNGRPCGVTIYQKNMAYVADGDCGVSDCPHHETLRGDDDMLGDPSVAQDLEWCGCGEPEAVDRMMLAYLESRAVEDWPKPAPAGVSKDAALLLAYLADDLGWTEHGPSIGGAWLTDDGRDALLNLRLLME